MEGRHYTQYMSTILQSSTNKTDRQTEVMEKESNRVTAWIHRERWWPSSWDSENQPLSMASHNLIKLLLGVRDSHSTTSTYSEASSPDGGAVKSDRVPLEK